MLQKGGGELNSVFAQSWRGCLCARASDVRAPARFRFPRTQSRASYMLTLCLRAVLISSPGTWDWTRMHALVVMHRRTLYENVDSAKIKVPFYTTDINILRVASMHRMVIHCIDISMTHYTPTSNHTDQFSNIITTTQKLQSNTEDKSVNFQAEIWQLFLSELYWKLTWA